MGDGVYASFDELALTIWLETSDGVTITNSIALDTQVMRALGAYSRELSRILG